MGYNCNNKYRGWVLKNMQLERLEMNKDFQERPFSLLNLNRPITREIIKGQFHKGNVL